MKLELAVAAVVDSIHRLTSSSFTFVSTDHSLLSPITVCMSHHVLTKRSVLLAVSSRQTLIIHVAHNNINLFR